MVYCLGFHETNDNIHYFPCSHYIFLQLCYRLGFDRVQDFGALGNAFCSRSGTNYMSLCPTFLGLLLCSYKFLCYGLGFDRVQGLGLYEISLFYNQYQLNVTAPHVPHQSFYVCAIFFVMGQGLIGFRVLGLYEIRYFKNSYWNWMSLLPTFSHLLLCTQIFLCR